VIKIPDLVFTVSLLPLLPLLSWLSAAALLEEDNEEEESGLSTSPDICCRRCGIDENVVDCGLCHWDIGKWLRGGLFFLLL